MPYFRKTICAYPNCPNYADPGSRYCAEHKKSNPTNRDTTSKFVSFYKTSWWKKHREAFLVSHPYCEECLKNGKHKLAYTVHHSQGFCDWSTFCDVSKWEAVCASCHSQIHTQVNNEELYNRSKNEQ